MDFPWGDPRNKKFVTNVGLITSKGPYGDNIMAAEWTHALSYSPALIGVCISPNHASHKNIMETKEFGVNLAAIDQNVASSVSGGSSGSKVDKIAILKELGVEFYPGTKIGALMVKGAALNAECKMIQAIELGTHTMFVGEVVEAAVTDKEPLTYHDGKYWKLTEQIEKTSQEVIDKIKDLKEQKKKD